MNAVLNKHNLGRLISISIIVIFLGMAITPFSNSIESYAATNKPLKLVFDGYEIPQKSPNNIDEYLINSNGKLLDRDGFGAGRIETGFRLGGGYNPLNLAKKDIVIKTYNKSISMKLDSNIMTITENGVVTKVDMGTKPLLHSDKYTFYLPVRPLAEALGYTVTYDALTNTVFIDNPLIADKVPDDQKEKLMLEARKGTKLDNGVYIPYEFFEKDSDISMQYVKGTIEQNINKATVLNIACGDGHSLTLQEGINLVDKFFKANSIFSIKNKLDYYMLTNHSNLCIDQHELELLKDMTYGTNSLNIEGDEHYAGTSVFFVGEYPDIKEMYMHIFYIYSGDTSDFRVREGFDL